MRVPRRLLLGVLGLLPLLSLGTLPACGSGDREDVLYVYAAASMQDALEELNAIYAKEHGTKIVMNCGSSGTLSVQIEQEGRCDVFLSAGDKEMDRIDALGLVDKESRKNLVSNQLVIVVPAGETDVKEPADLGKDVVQHLSIANPESVPAGRYAKSWLESAGLWDSVKDKILPGTDVRAALSQVEFGGAEAGIVYKTDAAISKKVEVAYAVPLDKGPKITYPAAAIKERPRRDQSLAYLAFLRSEQARAVFQRFGFLVDAS